MSDFKKHVKYYYKDYLIRLICSMVFYLVGVMMAVLILRAGDDGENTYAAMGTIFYYFFSFVFTILLGMVSFSMNFRLHISMGNTRKAFFSWSYLIDFLFNSLMFFFGLLLYKIENRLYHTFFGDLQNEIMLPSFISSHLVLILLLAAVAATSVYFFLGSTIYRFGKRCYAIIWIVWMFSFLVLPNVNAASETIIGSFIYRIYHTVAPAGINPSILLSFALILSVVMSLISYKLIRKQAL